MKIPPHFRHARGVFLAALMATVSLPAFATVQGDVNAAAPGATVNEAAGTYREQITITTDITLSGAGKDQTIIESPDFGLPLVGTADPIYPVILVQNTGNVTITNLTVDGRDQGHPTNNRFAGISFRNAGGTIDNVHITHTQESPTSGGQHGFGIYSIANNGTNRTLNITNTIIDNFQKSGIVLGGANLSGTFSGNTIIGRGAQSNLAQNGLQFSSGATYQITNNTISGIGYSPSTSAFAIGIFSAGNGTNVENNTINGTEKEIAIYNSGTTGVNIRDNTINNSQYGIYVASTNMTGEISNSKTITTVEDAIVVSSGRVAGGITNSGTIRNADGTAIGLYGLTGSTPINLNGGVIEGWVYDDARANGFSPVRVMNDFRTDGNFTVSSLAVDAGKTFRVDPGDIVRLNTLTPSAGTLGFTVDSATQYGQIIVDNAPDITGMKLAVYLSSPTALNEGSEIRVIDGGAPMIGTPGQISVFVNSVFYDLVAIDGSQASATTNTSDLFLKVAKSNKLASAASAGGGAPGNAAVAGVIQGLSGTTDPALLGIINNLGNAGGSNVRINQILEATQPQIDDSVVIGALNVSTSSMNMTGVRLAELRGAESGMSAGTRMSKDKKWWFQPYGQKTKQGFRDNVAGYDEHTFGGALGFDTDMYIDKSVLGIALGYGRTEIDSKNATRTHTDVDSYQVSLYGDYDITDKTFITAAVSYAYNRVFTLRHNVGGTAGLNARGDFAAHQFGGRFELGRDYAYRGFNLTPKLLLNAMHFTQQGYTENGAGGASLHVQGDDLNILELGARIEASWKYLNDDGSYWEPDVRLGYRYDFIGDPVTATSTFTGGGAAFRSEGFDPAQHKFNFGTGLSFYTGDLWDFRVNYDLDYKQDAVSHAGFIRATRKFK